MTHVLSGFRAVVRYGQEFFGWDLDEPVAFMQAHLATCGRGAAIDARLRAHARFSPARVKTCLHVYRGHSPKRTLFPAALQVLMRYHVQAPLNLVTDGHKVVQNRKTRGLNLEPFLALALNTHRLGARHAKPSLHCFVVIRRAERCDRSQMVYVGDNPAKDFVSFNQVGALTVRVRTRAHAAVVAQPGCDARITIPDLASLPAVLERGEGRRASQ
jgi:putative hydrolase of the HAD superfamily